MVFLYVAAGDSQELPVRLVSRNWTTQQEKQGSFCEGTKD